MFRLIFFFCSGLVSYYALKGNFFIINEWVLSGLLLTLQFEFELLFCLFSKYVSYSARNMASFALFTTGSKPSRQMTRCTWEDRNRGVAGSLRSLGKNTFVISFGKRIQMLIVWNMFLDQISLTVFKWSIVPVTTFPLKGSKYEPDKD